LAGWRNDLALSVSARFFAIGFLTIRVFGRMIVSEVIAFRLPPHSPWCSLGSTGVMNILIVYAHPNPRSFNAAMKDLAVDVLTKRGHDVQVSDLYAMNFDPVGGPRDFTDVEDPSCFRYQREQVRAHLSGGFVLQLQQEMDKLLWADFVLFQFPLWWFSLPAILKGWVDRVFAMGFAYSDTARFETGVFRGKRAMLSITTGGLPSRYDADGQYGEFEAVVRHVQFGMFHFVGIDVLPPFVAFGAARIQTEQREAYLATFRERLLQLDATAAVFEHPKLVV
jgi:NAD(P)H dehydrogenase (quinone)